MICQSCEWGDIDGEFVYCTSPNRLATYPKLFPWMGDDMKPAMIRHKPVEECEWWEKCEAI